MTEQAETNLRAIIDKQLDQPPLNELEMAQLESLLQDEDHMAYYLKSMELSAHMQDGVENAELGDLIQSPPNRRNSAVWLSVAVAVAACITFFAGWYVGTPQPSQPNPSPAHIATNTATNEPAHITGMFGVRWKNKPLNIQHQKEIDIESGLVELTYSTGVTVIIEGPARFSVKGDNAGSINYGKFVAHVPKGAEGFTVDYPMGKVVDLGTEFGVDLSPTGEFSVGVFKGMVELHPKGTQNISLIEENHALSQTADHPEQIFSIPFDRERFIRSVPSREFSWTVESPNTQTKQFDVSHLIWKPGLYRAILKWMSGPHAVNVSGATLWRNGQLIAEDAHQGVAGLYLTHQTKNNIFNLKISEQDYQKGTWILKVKFSTILNKKSQPIKTQGILLLEEGLAYQATADDFIGRWQYTHDGDTWERHVHADGTIDLIQNSQLRPGFKKSHWLVEEGVMKVWIPHHNAFETHLLRDPKTMIFIDEPYRNAVKIE